MKLNDVDDTDQVEASATDDEDEELTMSQTTEPFCGFDTDSSSDYYEPEDESSGHNSTMVLVDDSNVRRSTRIRKPHWKTAMEDEYKSLMDNKR